jgi:hypothetical protein
MHTRRYTQTIAIDILLSLYHLPMPSRCQNGAWPLRHNICRAALHLGVDVVAAISKFAAARFVEILAQLSLVLLSRGRCKSRSTMVAAVVGRDTSAIAATRSVDSRVRTRLDPTSFDFKLKVVVGRDTGRHI